MSLIKSKNFLFFASSRYVRLAPAMLIASIFIYLTSFYITERPAGAVNIQDFLPSLTFISDTLLTKLTGINIKSLDSVFWSLFVEVKFYFVVATLFFIFKDKKLNILTIIYIIFIFIFFLKNFFFHNQLIEIIFKVLLYIEANFYGWFLIGISTLKYLNSPSKKNFLITLTFCLLASIITSEGDPLIFTACVVVCLFFLMPVFYSNFRVFLSSKFFLFFGFISYPLYLFHQNFVTGMALKMHAYYPNLPSFLYPIPFILIASLISYYIAKNENIIKNIYIVIFFKKILKKKIF